MEPACKGAGGEEEKGDEVMVYTYTIEQLQRFPYPNLIAEICEHGYSMATIANHMGYETGVESYPLIRAKMSGRIDVTIREVLALAMLFNRDLDYLFDSELSLVDGRPKAYWLIQEERKIRAARADTRRKAAQTELNRFMKAQTELGRFMKGAAQNEKD